MPTELIDDGSLTEFEKYLINSEASVTGADEEMRQNKMANMKASMRARRKRKWQ